VVFLHGRCTRPLSAPLSGVSKILFLVRSGFDVLKLVARDQQQGTEFMARDFNSFAKRQREMRKKQKAEEKRARRRKKKERANDTDDPNSDDRFGHEQ
jgi:hypothetical protein